MIKVGAAASHIKSGESVTESVGLAFDLASPATLLGLELLMLVTATDEFSITYWLEPKPAEVRHAREQVRKALPGWSLGASTDLAELIVSELVTNALRHSDYPIQVSLCYDGRDLWIESGTGGMAGRFAWSPAPKTNEAVASS